MNQTFEELMGTPTATAFMAVTKAFAKVLAESRGLIAQQLFESGMSTEEIEKLLLQQLVFIESEANEAVDFGLWKGDME